MSTNSNSSQPAQSLPTLRSGVTWHNPQRIASDQIPAGCRFLTSVETHIPKDAQFTRRPESPSVTWVTSVAQTLALEPRKKNTYVTRQPLPPEALPIPAEFRKLRTGVTYRNPEGALPEHIPPGYRLLTSVESEVPSDGETPAQYHPGSAAGPWKSAFGPMMNPNLGRYTYRTRTPFPAAALPVVEPELPAGVTWLGKPLDQESLDAGWRRLCTADKTSPEDMEFLWCGQWQPAGCPRTNLNVLHGFKPPFTFSYRTKAPLPEFKKPAEFPALPAGVVWRNPNNLSPEYFGVADGWRPLCSLDQVFPDDYQWSGTPFDVAGPWKTACRYVAASLSGFYNSKENYRTKAPIPQPKPVEFPALPAGVQWVNLCGLTPVDIGVADGWRPLCTLDKAIPVDAEALKGTPKIWLPSTRRGKPVATRCTTYRTKNPIPELSWPELPAGHEYINPENFSPEKLGAAEGWRPLCTLDESYPDDHQYLYIFHNEWKPGLRCREKPKAVDAHHRTYRTKAPIPQPKPVTVSAGTIDGHPVTTSEIELRKRVADLERQNQYLRDSRSNIIRISEERRHAILETNQIIDGTLDPSHVHLSATARKVAALHKMKTAAELSVADLQKANESQTAVLDGIAKLVGDESGTLESLLPAVEAKLRLSPDTAVMNYRASVEQALQGVFPSELLIDTTLRRVLDLRSNHDYHRAQASELHTKVGNIKSHIENARKRYSEQTGSTVGSDVSTGLSIAANIVAEVTRK